MDGVTKKDLELAIVQIKHDTLKFVVWTEVSVNAFLVTTLGGMLIKGFYWF